MTDAARDSLYLRYGRPGEPIPGSRLVRGYCPTCNDPIRINPGQHPLLTECKDCRGCLGRKVIAQRFPLKNGTAGGCVPSSVRAPHRTSSRRRAP